MKYYAAQYKYGAKIVKLHILAFDSYDALYWMHENLTNNSGFAVFGRI